MEWVDLVSRWIHVGTVIVVVGGGFFTRFVLLPVVSKRPDAAEFMEAVRERWKRFVHAGIALLLVSGFYNYFQAMPKHKGQPLYHALVGTKILLALAIFFLLSVMVGRSAKFAGMRANPKAWLGLILFLAAIVIGISGYVKVAVPAKAPAESKTALLETQLRPGEIEIVTVTAEE